MALLEAKIYHGCVRCDGLFSTSTYYTQHAVVCTGERQKSDCQLFACPRDRFLAIFESEVTRNSVVDSNSGNVSDDTPGGLPLSVPGCYTSPLRKVKVIGIVKRTLTQFPQNDKVVLCSDISVQDTERQPIVTTSGKNLQGVREIVTYDCNDVPNKLEAPLSTQQSVVKVSDSEPSKSSQGNTSNSQVPHISLIGPGTIQYCDPQTNSTTEIQFNPGQYQGSSNITIDGTQNQKSVQDQVIQERSLKESGEISSAVQNEDRIQSSTTEVHYTEISTKLPEDGKNVSADSYGLDKASADSDELRGCRLEQSQEINSADLCQSDPQTAFRCEVCGLESCDEELLQRHSQSHESAIKNDFVTDKPKNFLCELCPLQFKNRSSLTRHSAKKHNGKSNFTCEYSGCGYVAVNSASLRDHTRKHTGEWLACDHDNCKFTTRFEKALSLHKAKHQGKTRFICEVCGYKTIEAGSFRRHCLNHTDKKLFKCPDCSYKANSRYCIVKHIYGKHINHKRYACNRCDFKTAYYSGLSMHLMSHEGVKPYKCSACCYRSNLSNKVKRHCAQKHKGGEASVSKVENCLKFDVKDYLNPEVQKLEVKVLRLGEDGSEELMFSDEPKVAPAPIDLDISEDGVLLCETNMPSLPSESAETLEAISMIDGGFNLCNDPTFQLDSVSQAFRSEDSNNDFVTRPAQMICEPDVELIKDLDTQNMETMDSDLSIQTIPSQGIQDISENKTDMFSNIDIPSLEPLESTDQNTTVEETESFSQHQNSSVDIVLTNDPKESTALKSKHQILTSVNPFFQIITVPLINVPNLLLQQTKDGQQSIGIHSLTGAEPVKDSQPMTVDQNVTSQPQTDARPEEPVNQVTFAQPVAGSQAESGGHQHAPFLSTSIQQQANVPSENSLQQNTDGQPFTILKQTADCQIADIPLRMEGQITGGQLETNSCPISVTHSGIGTNGGSSANQVTISVAGSQGTETLDSRIVRPVAGSQQTSKPLQSLLSPDFIKFLAEKRGQEVEGEGTVTTFQSGNLG